MLPVSLGMVARVVVLGAQDQQRSDREVDEVVGEIAVQRTVPPTRSGSASRTATRGRHAGRGAVTARHARAARRSASRALAGRSALGE